MSDVSMIDGHDDEMPSPATILKVSRIFKRARLKPDGYLPDGTPVWFRLSRGNTKSSYQLEMYKKLLGIE